MSANALAKALRALREATAEAAWCQWATIFNLAAAKRPARAIIDPEALILGSIALADLEPRLRGVTSTWARIGSHLMSVQRAKNLSNSFPDAVVERVAEFASIAVSQGNDARWRSLAGRQPPQAKHGVETAAPLVAQPPALMLRLRLGLGVGIKADVLALLVGSAGAALTVQQIAAEASYFGRAVRRAVEDLAAAGFIEPRSTSPISYRVNVRDWKDVLAIDPNDPPLWRRWSAVYSLVAALSEWVTRMPRSDVAAASAARDVWEQHRKSWAGLPGSEIRTERFLGPAFLGALTNAVEQWTEYVQSVV